FDSRRIAMTLRSRRWATKLPFFLMAAALLCGPSPATGQELPDGKGKEIVAASCNSCHPFHARLGGGYTPEGWRTVMRMMANHGVVLPSDQLATVTEYLTKNFPENRDGHRVPDAGPGREGSAHADLRSERDPLVHGPERQPGGAARSEDGRDQAPYSAHREVAPLRHGGELEGHRVLRPVRHEQGWKRRSEDAEDSRVPVAGSGVTPAAHRDHRRRHRLVQRLLARLSGPPRPHHRQGDRVAVAERAEVRALWHLG